MAKKRRSREFKNSSQVIDIEEARSKRQKKRQKQQARIRSEAAANKPARRGVRQNKKRRTLIYTVIIVVIVTVIGVSIYNIIDLKREQNEVLARQAALQKEKEKLQNELEHLNDPDYIEEQARAQLRLVMPGETIYVFPKASEKTKDKAKETTNESN